MTAAMPRWLPYVAIAASVTAYGIWLLAAPFSKWMLLPLITTGAILAWHLSQPERFFRRCALTCLGLTTASAIAPNIRALASDDTFQLRIEFGSTVVAVTGLVAGAVFGYLELLRQRQGSLGPTGGSRSQKTSVVIRESNLQNTTIVGGDQHNYDNSSSDKTLDTAARLIADGALDQAIAILDQLEASHWTGLSRPLKFRHRALLGRAHMLKENDKIASNRFREAQQYAPEDEKARVLAVQAELLDEHLAKAHSLAAALQAEYPALPQATAMFIKSAPADTRVEDVFPEPWEGVSAIVAVALADKLNRAGRSHRAENVLRKTVAQPENFEYWHALGVSMLLADNVDDPKVAVAPERLREALGHLKTALALLKGQMLPSVRNALWVNAAVVHRRLGESAEQWAALRHADECLPNDPGTLGRMGDWYLEDGKTDQAIDTFRAVHNARGVSRATLLLALSLAKRNVNDDIGEGKRLLSSILEASDVGDDLQRDAAELRLNVSQITGQPHEGLALLKTLRPFLGDFRTGEWTVHLSMQGELPDDAKVAASDLFAQREKWTEHELLKLGVLLFRCGLVGESFETLRGLAPRNKVTDATVTLIKAAEATDNRDFLLGLCADLLESGVDEAGVVESYILALNQQGDTTKALGVSAAYLASHDNPFIRLQQTRLALSIGRFDLVDADVTRLPQPCVGLGEVAVLVSNVLRAANKPLQAIEFAYRNLRLNRNESAAWKAVIDSFLPIHGEVPLVEPDIVSANAAVRYREGDGASHWAILEDSSPDPTQSEYPLKHPLVVAMLSKRVGETFEVGRHLLPSRTYIVEEIRSKYVYHYHRCLDAWERQFPETPGPQMIPIPDDVEGMLKTFQPALEARAERTEELLTFYRTTPALSLFMWGRAQNMTVFSAMHHIAGDPDTDVRCTFIQQSDVGDLLHSLDRNAELIVDSAGLATLLLLDRVTLLERMEVPIAVASGVVDELRRHRQEVTAAGTGGSLAFRQGRVVFHMMDADARNAYLKRIDDAVEWLEKRATVFSEVRSSLSESEWRVWVALGGAAAAESLQRAMRSAACLWTDDASIGGFAAQKGACAVWTQLVLGWAMGKGRIESTLLHDVSARLVGWRFVPTRVPPKVYAAAASIAQWEPTAWPMPEHLRLVEQSQWPTVQVGALAAAAIRFWWSDAPSDERATALTVAVLNRLVTRVDGELIVNTLFRILPNAFGLDVLNLRRAFEVLKSWAMTHGELHEVRN